MRPSVMFDVVKTNYEKNIPILVEGQPGIGKSTIPEQVAASLGVGFINFNVPMRGLEDYGVPFPNRDKGTLDMFIDEHLWPVEGNERFGDEGILMFDELASAGNAEQKACASIIYDRHVHGRKIKPGWSFVATSNRSKDRAGANRILSHLSDRLVRYTLEPSLDDWCEWAIDSGVALEVISFVRFRPHLLSKFDPNEETCPSPRGWAKKVSPIVGMNAPWEYEHYVGAVGEGAGTEFASFLGMYRKLPNIDAILMDPANAEIPTEMSVLYAVGTAVGARATVENMDRIYAYTRRMPPEFQVLVMVDARRRDAKICNTKGFMEWATKEGAKTLVSGR